MYERDPVTAAPRTWFLIDQLDALAPEVVEGSIEVADSDPQVVQPGATPLDEPLDRRVWSCGLDELEVNPSDLEHGLLDPVVLDMLA